MNYIYTGNAFILKFSEQIGWTEDDLANGINQNKEVKVATVKTEES